MTILEIATAVVKAEHGWAVAEQFEATFEGESFEEQNVNALIRIKQIISELFDSKALSVEASDELEDYLTGLKSYLKGYSESL
jgi:hypothetical protein